MSDINELGQFIKGSEPWNKGITGYMGANATSFKKGNLPVQTKPKGHIRRSIHRGRPEYYINVDWHNNRKPNNSYKWYLWEVENQRDRPVNMVLYIKNNDSDGIRTDNFEIITHAELLERNRL